MVLQRRYPHASISNRWHFFFTQKQQIPIVSNLTLPGKNGQQNILSQPTTISSFQTNFSLAESQNSFNTVVINFDLHSSN